MVQNETKICLSCSISKELYIIWSTFVVYECRIMFPGGFSFHFFKILIFQLGSGVKRPKWPKMTKKIVSHAPCLRNHHIIFIFGKSWSSCTPSIKRGRKAFLKSFLKIRFFNLTVLRQGFSSILFYSWSQINCSSLGLQ